MCTRMLALLLVFASSVAAQLETAPLKSRRAAERYRRIVNILETKRITVNWDDVTIREAVADLRRQTGLNFVISSAAGDAVDDEISCKLRNIPVGPVLHVLGRRDVVFQHRHGVIWVTSREDATRRAAVLRIYDTRGLFYVPPDQAAAALAAHDSGDPGYSCFGAGGFGSQMIGAWVPGSPPMEFPQGAGFELEPGSRLVMQMHYNVNFAQPQADQSELNLMLSTDEPEYLVSMPLLLAGVSIAPHDPAATSSGSYTNNSI